MNQQGTTVSKISFDLARMETEASIPDEVDAELRPFFEEEAKIEMQAIETILQSWDTSDAPDSLKKLRRHFHTLKGTASSIGHARIGTLAAGMETACGQFNPEYALALRGQIIKTCIMVLQTIRLLIEESRQPKFSPVPKETIIKTARSIASLREQGTEMKGAA